MQYILLNIMLYWTRCFCREYRNISCKIWSRGSGSRYSSL